MDKINIYICTFMLILDTNAPNTVMDRAQVMRSKNKKPIEVFRVEK